VPGTGLGLNITRSLVEMQGGKIWFESEYRKAPHSISRSRWQKSSEAMAMIASVGVCAGARWTRSRLASCASGIEPAWRNIAGLAVVIASHQYQPREVLNGVSSLLGDTPMIGFSSPAGLTREGQHPHSVVVALLSGDFQCRYALAAGYAQSGRETASKIEQHARRGLNRQSMLFFADGFNGDAEQFCGAPHPIRTEYHGRAFQR
jgi:hypothetical protein